ncbi:MAG: hypothetical protein ACI8ZB_005058 [Desulforhopalus sp.]|jgi:hypothetical protein
MAGGWTSDGAVQDQIDATVGDAGKISKKPFAQRQEPEQL